MAGKSTSFFIFYEEPRKKELHKDCKECNNSKHFRVNASGRFFNTPAIRGSSVCGSNGLHSFNFSMVFTYSPDAFTRLLEKCAKF
ncbi:hypothetical protein [Treponema sp. OMZ 857]|uniref:hypothetical protein n=1 Tax=Treponema sp. OMZ 857 TaxID=1643513 RepID=UPI0020A3EEAB|nr:hypothetical protein [Treponema sp. OMZ 857]UTC44264.1 hypothetical protein E4N66_09405 [Treponema sp. OMZ 857]